MKQNAKQSSLRTTATNKSQLNSKETGKKAGVTKPVLKRTGKPSDQQPQLRQQPESNRVINEDSVVISKSALDSLLKQLVDAKQVTNPLPPIGSHQDNNLAPNLQQKAVTPLNHNGMQKLQQKGEHDIKDLDYSDVPGLSPPKPVTHQSVKDTSMEEYNSGKLLITYY